MMSSYGLSQEEADERLASEGANELPSPERRTPWMIVREVITEPMFALLIGASGIYIVLGELQESIVLGAFVTLSVSITIVQEWRSEHVLEALRDMTSPRALVLRDGEPVRIAGRDVVRGDVMLVREGDRVAADAVLIAGETLEADESLLTGESMAVHKKPLQEGARDIPLQAAGGDGLPFIYAGTLIVRGSGRALVQATGVRSQIGLIGKSLASIDVQQPRLRQQMRTIVRVFALSALVFSLIVTLVSGFLHEDWLQALLNGIALGMSLLPEEFPLVLTVFMVMGAWRISQVRVLTRRAAAIETLGAATVLCTDKTGTLTQNKMTIVQLWNEQGSWQPGDGMSTSFHDMAHIEIAAIGAFASLRESIDPMDTAFFKLSPHIGENMPQRLQHYAPSPRLLAMVNVYDRDGVRFAAAKGAPEAILRLCHQDEARTQAIQEAVNAMSAQGLRVLAIAKATLGNDDLPTTPDNFPFTFLGLAGFADPIRASVPRAVREAQRAGVRVIMITGDHPVTALAIARQAGILPAAKEGGAAPRILTGDVVAKMPAAELKAAVKETCVFARIMPDQKLRIVKALRANGEVVAMTGDGVNDAPSLKAADIGIAMGGRGTDVAREAASIVLLDDDFKSLIATIRLGRRIYDNLQKAFLYIIAVHMPIVGLAILPLLFDKPLILTPILIAFLEMVIDPACSIVLEAEHEEEDIMKRKPRNPKVSVLSKRIVCFGLMQGFLALLIVSIIWSYATYQHMMDTDIRTLVFTTLSAINIALILANRSYSTSLRTALRRPNPFLWKGVSIVIGIFALVTLWRPLQDLFHFGALHFHDILVALISGALMLASVEELKKLRLKKS